MKASFFLAALNAEDQIHELGIHALSLLQGEKNAVDRAITAVKQVLNGEDSEITYLTPEHVVDEVHHELSKMSDEFKTEFIEKTLSALRPKLEDEARRSRDAFRQDYALANLG